MFELEILHARWAMLAVPGCLVPELLSLGGLDIGEPVWWKARLCRSVSPPPEIAAPLTLSAPLRPRKLSRWALPS